MELAFLSPSPMELMVIAVIALIVLGPSRLPDAARSVGKGMREMRDAFQGMAGDDDEDDERVPASRPRGDDDDFEDDAGRRPGRRHPGRPRGLARPQLASSRYQNEACSSVPSASSSSIVFV